MNRVFELIVVGIAVGFIVGTMGILSFSAILF